jgi:hypothetical protein
VISLHSSESQATSWTNPPLAAVPGGFIPVRYPSRNLAATNNNAKHNRGGAKVSPSQY